MAAYHDNLSQNFGNLGLGPNNGQYPPRSIHNTTRLHRKGNTAHLRQHLHTSPRLTSLPSRANGGLFMTSSTSAGTMPTRRRGKRSGRHLDIIRRRDRGRSRLRAAGMTDACGLREFLSHISGNKGGFMNGEPYDGEDLKNFRNKPLLGAGLENAADFDINDAARKMYEKRIGNFKSPAWCKVKNGRSFYLPSFERIATRVGDIKATMSVEDLENNKSRFQQLDMCVDGVNVDRRAEMSEFLIPELKKAARGGYTIVSRPYPGNRRLFLYPNTIQSIRESVQGLGDNKESSFRARKQDLDKALAEFMKTKEAQNHQAPIEKWDGVKARMLPVQGCSRRPASWPADT
ncbi:hypothetical protein NQ176_g9174 [Zarea fungicola]|uniref:Uncharacterized protein n=1 Tax=Zarea fungicola TaxID=93591 RepID=A0ACC1MQ95_9HYPO|nr:hypothetical protein NQ176_g9174 [Lecanicillium fungicola]